MRVKSFLIVTIVLLMTLPSLAQRRSVIDGDGRLVNQSRLTNTNHAGQLLMQNPAANIRARMGMWRTNVVGNRLDGQRGVALRRLANGQGGVTGVNWHQAQNRISQFFYRPVIGAGRRTDIAQIRGASLLRNGQRQISSRLQPNTTRALFVRPSRYFASTPKQNNNPEPDPMLAVEAFAKNSLALFVQAKSENGMFPVVDPMTNDVWNTWLVSNPKLRQVGNDYVAQAGFYGSAPGSSDVFPMVVQFRLEGADKSWHVRDVKLVTVNNVARPGVAQFLRFVESRDGTVGVEEIKDVL